jgi:hypothetical protein
MLNTSIYHVLPPTCFHVCYTIFSKTAALFAQELYALYQCCYMGCAIECTLYTVL